MATWEIDVRGDTELINKFIDIGEQLNRWGWNAAFRPAAKDFLPLISTYANLPTPGNSTVDHRSFRLGKQGSSGTLKVRTMRRSRVMVGVMAISQFGTTDATNDPYYGAFVNYGHRIFKNGELTDEKTKPKLQEQRSFETGKERAGNLATGGLKNVIESIWTGRTSE